MANYTKDPAQLASNGVDQNNGPVSPAGASLIGYNATYPTVQNALDAVTPITAITGILYGNGTSVAAAVPANFPTLNQNTTGNAASATTLVGAATVAALRLVSGTATGQAIFLEGYTTQNDGGQGPFQWGAYTTDNGGTIITPTGQTAGSWYRVYVGNVNVSWFGADATGVSDSTPAFGLANTYVSNLKGGIIDAVGVFKLSSLTLGANVSLRGAMDGRMNAGGGGAVDYGTVINATTTGTLMTASFGSGVEGILFNGLGSATALKGFYSNATGAFVKRCGFNNFADEGIYLDTSSVANTLEDILVQNCLLNTTRSAVNGTVHVLGTDHFLNRIEATASLLAKTSTNLYCAGIVIGGTNCFVSSCIGEISDQGIYVSGNLNRFSICRADLNMGHGFNVIGAGNQIIGCLGRSNSQDTTSTYDNFRADNASGNNLYVGCQSTSDITNVPKYGYEDLVMSASNKNWYINCINTGTATTPYSAPLNYGSVFFNPSGAVNPLTTNSTTPSVEGYSNYNTQNTSSTLITNFTGGQSGQILTLFCTDNFTTIQHNGSTITLYGLQNLKLVSGVWYQFFNNGGEWYQLSRDYTPSASAPSIVTATVYQNTTVVPQELYLPVTFTPTGSAASTCAVALGTSATPPTIGTETVPIGTALDSFIKIMHLRIPPGWYYEFTVTNATIGTAMLVTG